MYYKTVKQNFDKCYDKRNTDKKVANYSLLVHAYSAMGFYSCPVLFDLFLEFTACHMSLKYAYMHLR